MRTFHPSDDKQLWRIMDCANGVDRSWPIYVTAGTEAGKECVLVELAHPIDTKSQWRFVSEILTPSAFDSGNAKWLIRPTILESLARKCPGVTPAYYLKWPGLVKAPVSPSGEMAESGEIEDIEASDEPFIRYACAEAGETDIQKVRWVYSLICSKAVRWMLEKRRPLRLGFATLYALPYRANWKPILHSQREDIVSVFRNNRRNTKAVLEATGFNELLYSTDMLEMNENTFGWSIDAIVEKPWEKAVAQVERDCLKAAKTPVKYLMRWSRLVNNHYDQIIACFSAWVTKASRPVGSIDTSLPKAAWILSAKRKRGSVRPSVPKPAPARYTTDTFSPNDDAAATPATSLVEDERVPKMPDL